MCDDPSGRQCRASDEPHGGRHFPKAAIGGQHKVNKRSLLKAPLSFFHVPVSLCGILGFASFPRQPGLKIATEVLTTVQKKIRSEEYLYALDSYSGL